MKLLKGAATGLAALVGRDGGGAAAKDLTGAAQHHGITWLRQSRAVSG